MKQTIGERIKLAREKTDLTQEDLARQAGIERASLSQIENNNRSVKAEELITFSKILNMSTDQLLGIEPVPYVVLEKSTKPTKELPSLRISVPAKNKEKFKEVLLYLLNKVGGKPNIGETVLYKLLYFIDFNYYEKYEEQLIGATYIKNHHGPTPVEFKSIIEDMIKNKELEQVTSQHFQYLQKKYLAHREPNLSLFNANEIQLIDEVLIKLSNMSAKAISDYSHQDVPWVVTPLHQKIDYEAVFYRTPPYTVRDYDDADI